MADPIPVKVTNTVDVKPAPGDAVPPVTEKTTETHEKTVVTGAPIQAPPPAIIADDAARKWLAFVTIGQFLLVVGYIIFTVKNGETNNAEMMILGAEIGFVTTILNYFYGSSSGSTAKSAAAQDKL
jgi:hypothetical protein